MAWTLLFVCFGPEAVRLAAHAVQIRQKLGPVAFLFPGIANQIRQNVCSRCSRLRRTCRSKPTLSFIWRVTLVTFGLRRYSLCGRLTCPAELPSV